MTTPNKVREAFEAWAENELVDFTSDAFWEKVKPLALLSWQAACADRDKVIALLKKCESTLEKVGALGSYDAHVKDGIAANVDAAIAEACQTHYEVEQFLKAQGT